MMKKYEILEHKADLKIGAFGKTKEKLFLNMLKATADFQKAEIIKEKEKNKRKIKIESPDLGALLVDFLSEVLYLSQIHKEIYKDIKFKKLTDHSTSSGQAELEGELIGQKFERIGLDIKAVTYHGLDIKQKKDRTWEATVLFDI